MINYPPPHQCYRVVIQSSSSSEQKKNCFSISNNLVSPNFPRDRSFFPFDLWLVIFLYVTIICLYSPSISTRALETNPLLSLLPRLVSPSIRFRQASFPRYIAINRAERTCWGGLIHDWGRTRARIQFEGYENERKVKSIEQRREE